MRNSFQAANVAHKCITYNYRPKERTPMLKQKDLHALIQQHIPQIHYLEVETTESAEGECTLWERDDCTILLDLAIPEMANLPTALKNISAKLTWLNEHRADIIAQLFAEPKFSGSLKTERAQVEPKLHMVYCSFFVESTEEIFCDFAVSAEDNLLNNRFADCSLEEDNEFTFNSMEQD